MRRRHPDEQHIGDGDGRIALWLNESSALALASMFRYDDAGALDILAAIARAYPTEDEGETA